MRFLNIYLSINYQKIKFHIAARLSNMNITLSSFQRTIIV